MDAHLLEATLTHLTEMRERLDRAAGIAKAAETWAENRNMEKAIEIALDVEQLDLRGQHVPQCRELDEPHP